MSVRLHAFVKSCAVAGNALAFMALLAVFAPAALANTATKTHAPPVAGHQIAGGDFTLAPFAHVVFCHAYLEQCRVARRSIRKALVRLTPERLREIGSVNQRINASIRPTPDAPGPLGDRWLLSPTRGDCDDYAVTKRAALLKAGWPSRSLLLAAARLPDGQDHLVLVVRTTSGDLIADNLSQTVRPLATVRYQWTMVQDEANPRFWRKTNPRNPLLAIVNPLGGAPSEETVARPAADHVMKSSVAWALRGTTQQ